MLVYLIHWNVTVLSPDGKIQAYYENGPWKGYHMVLFFWCGQYRLPSGKLHSSRNTENQQKSTMSMTSFNSNAFSIPGWSWSHDVTCWNQPVRVGFGRAFAPGFNPTWGRRRNGCPSTLPGAWMAPKGTEGPGRSWKKLLLLWDLGEVLEVPRKMVHFDHFVTFVSGDVTDRNCRLEHKPLGISLTKLGIDEDGPGLWVTKTEDPLVLAYLE